MSETREGKQMKFFIDTANVQEIKEAHALGMVDGVTTNPSLVAKEGKDFKELIKEICGIVDGPVSAEVVSVDADGIVQEARDLTGIADNIVVKVPLIEEGLKAVKILTDEGIKTNVTLCFSPVQALMAAKVGAAYISPFVGRLDDINHVGMELVEQILTIYENYAFDTEVIVASIRSPLHVLDSALMGADIATIPFKVIKQLAKHPLTDIGLANFLADWKKSV
jgi:transaldolase